jgi:hypothetical protein
MRAIFGNNCAKGCLIYVIAVVAVVIVASMGLSGLRAKFGGAQVEGNAPQYTIQSTGGTVPSQGTLPDTAAGGGGGALPTPTRVPVAPRQPAANATPAPTKGQGGTITGDGGEAFYVVQPGDTLWGIARNFGVEIDALTSLNGLSDSIIYAGQVLLLPSSTQQQALQPTPAANGNSGAPAVPSMPDTGINKKP